MAKLKPHKTSKLLGRLLSRGPRDKSDSVRPPSEREFNRRRRMLAFVDGIVRIAPPNCEKFHREWFVEEGWMGWDDERAYDKAVRGFTDHRGLFLYHGSTFTGMGVMQSLTVAMIDDLVEQLALPSDTKVWFGLRPHPSELWAGEGALGTVGDLLEYLTQDAGAGHV